MNKNFSNYISHIDALEKWTELFFHDFHDKNISFKERCKEFIVLSEQQKKSGIMSLKDIDHLQDISRDKNDKKYVKNYKKFIHIKRVVENIAHNFLTQMILCEIDCYLKKENQAFEEFSYILLESYYSEILFNGIILHQEEVFHIFYNKNVFFKIFIPAAEKNFKILERSDLQPILHLPEGKALKYGLSLSCEEIEQYHKEKDKNGKSVLADKLQAVDETNTLCDTWATNLSTLLAKRIKT